MNYEIPLKNKNTGTFTFVSLFNGTILYHSPYGTLETPKAAYEKFWKQEPRLKEIFNFYAKGNTEKHIMVALCLQNILGYITIYEIMDLTGLKRTTAWNKIDDFKVIDKIGKIKFMNGESGRPITGFTWRFE